MAQAVRDLEQGEASLRDGRHEWACFAAHQAAEKAVKALHLHGGAEAWGHVVRTLLSDLPETHDVDELLVDRARVLDGHYIPARYANGHEEGAPFENYGALQSAEAMEHAREIVRWAGARMAGGP